MLLRERWDSESVYFHGEKKVCVKVGMNPINSLALLNLPLTCCNTRIVYLTQIEMGSVLAALAGQEGHCAYERTTGQVLFFIATLLTTISRLLTTQFSHS